ncbi:alpha/beta fold hydrolase [Pararhodobacter oceanensis]|uniref:Alpha/beta hydrolase n=1 Tax=Pararhodobacter oceanensis TaxID=2172121 RepID=A0A2T8HW81_9RHOB|nr:alpha/beta hydrolase [Pararhodobacter oceanensis]PVH29697.1 alpha/beta hydrolase [Pararhodobacter oceanensis]
MELPAAPLAACDAPEGGRAYWLKAADGQRLRLAHWPGERQVLILPGRTEYIEKYGLVIRDLAAQGWGAMVIDWRGQGLADRSNPDASMGDVARFSDFQLDLDAYLNAAADLGASHAPWLAHSMGGCIALRGLIRGKTPPAVAFSGPMLGLNQPAYLTPALRAMALVMRPLGLDKRYAPTTGPDFGLPGMAFEDNTLTSDRAQFDRMKAQIVADPRLALGGPSLRWMIEALAEMEALAALPSPQIPALFGLGSDEEIVSQAAIRTRVANWPGAELAFFEGARHELTMERPEVRDDFLARMLTLFNEHAS